MYRDPPIKSYRRSIQLLLNFFDECLQITAVKFTVTHIKFSEDQKTNYKIYA